MSKGNENSVRAAVKYASSWLIARFKIGVTPGRIDNSGKWSASQTFIRKPALGSGNSIRATPVDVEAT
jgi:hypothetical protein